MSDRTICDEPTITRLVDATRRLATLQAESTLAQLVAEQAMTLFGARGATLFLADGDTAVAVATAGRCPAAPVGMRRPLDDLMHHAGKVGTTAIPLQGTGERLGLLWISGDPGVAEGSAAPIFATQAAMALENARRCQHHVATLAHELRNPLAGIVTALRALERFGVPDQALELCALIGRQVKHLTRLVEDVLDMTRLRHGTVSLRHEPVDLAEVVRAAVEMLLAAGRHREHDVALRARGSLTVNGDATRLEQVVRNLLDNAVKYSPAGTRVDVTLECSGDTAILRVRDEGIGIDPAMLSRLFDPYAQAEPAGEHAAGGLGLGLPVVRAIVEAHGGTITASSAGAGTGSEFAVRLPLAPAVTTPRARGETPARTPAAPARPSRARP